MYTVRSYTSTQKFTTTKKIQKTKFTENSSFSKMSACVTHTKNKLHVLPRNYVLHINDCFTFKRQDSGTYPIPDNCT